MLLLPAGWWRYSQGCTQTLAPRNTFWMIQVNAGQKDNCEGQKCDAWPTLVFSECELVFLSHKLFLSQYALTHFSTNAKVSTSLPFCPQIEHPGSQLIIFQNHSFFQP